MKNKIAKTAKQSNFEKEYREFVSNVITNKEFIKFLESTLKYLNN